MNEFGRSALEQREYERLHYPGTDILINKLGIRDPGRLQAAERYHNIERLQVGLPEEARNLSISGLRAIHHTLLRDVYDWAGSFRTYTTGRTAPFARPEFIEPMLEGAFADLRAEQNLRGLAPEAFAARAAVYVNEINAAHPFVEGNGRMQRVWLRNLGEQAGYDVRFRRGDKPIWERASVEGFYRSDELMAGFIVERLTPLRARDRNAPDRSDRYIESLLDRARPERERPVLDERTRRLKESYDNARNDEQEAPDRGDRERGDDEPER